MNLREMQEHREYTLLSKYAAYSDQSQGRDYASELCDIRTIYQQDRDKIIHSKAFRRLNGKTQVFLTPEGDHYRTRLTHTLEVSQIARTIAKALRLNEDLTEAIALGHDLGHTPFGHAGERALNEICPGGFAHYLQSVRVVEKLEKGGKGLNLTKEVRDGIANHQVSTTPATLEGRIVRICDKIAYVNHDIDDAIRGHIIKEEEIPAEFTDVLGHSLSERLNTMIHDIIMNSEDKNDITMSAHIEDAFQKLRAYMFKSVYTNPVAKSQEAKAEQMVQELYRYYLERVELLPKEFRVMMDEQGEPAERVVCDYVAGMTDRYAVAKFKEITIPDAWDIF